MSEHPFPEWNQEEYKNAIDPQTGKIIPAYHGEIYSNQGVIKYENYKIGRILGEIMNILFIPLWIFWIYFLISLCFSTGWIMPSSTRITEVIGILLFFVLVVIRFKKLLLLVRDKQKIGWIYWFLIIPFEFAIFLFGVSWGWMI